MDYSRTFGTKVCLSTDLQNKMFYDELVADGFIWIRPKHIVHFHQIVRVPTIGRWVELSRIRAVYSVPIDSLAGKGLINKLCYI